MNWLAAEIRRTSNASSVSGKASCPVCSQLLTPARVVRSPKAIALPIEKVAQFGDDPLQPWRQGRVVRFLCCFDRNAVVEPVEIDDELRQPPGLGKAFARRLGCAAMLGCRRPIATDLLLPGGDNPHLDALDLARRVVPHVAGLVAE